MASRQNVDLPPHTTVDGLALAMTSSSSPPLLLLDGDLSVIAASDSFCAALDIDVSKVRGRRFAELGAGEWDVPQVGATVRVAAAKPGTVVSIVRRGSPPLASGESHATQH